MLVLSRKTGEQITVSDGTTTITVQLMRTGVKSVRLGIAAPEDFQIMRTELEAGTIDEHDTQAEAKASNGGASAAAER